MYNNDSFIFNQFVNKKESHFIYSKDYKNRLVKQFLKNNVSKIEKFHLLRFSNSSLEIAEKHERDYFIELLEKYSTFEGLSGHLFNKIKKHQDIITNRLIYLFQTYSEENNDIEISIKSLRSLLFFLYEIEDYAIPSITVNDLGQFNVRWKKDGSNLLSLRFKEKYELDYVIFKPSHFTEKRIILNGSMNLLDFVEYLQEIKVTFIQKKYE